jgi:hypothetical protein
MFSSRFKLAASLSGRRLASAMAGDRLLSVSAFWTDTPESVFARWRSVEAWCRDDPSLLRWCVRHLEKRFRPPGPVLDATKPSFFLGCW